MLGCSPNVIDENKALQKIDNLDMNIFSKKGEKKYSISSPNSSYDNIELKFELSKPIINIFNGKEIKYIISSEESTLLDNNKILKLKGNVKLKTQKKDEDKLFADYFTWDIEETNYLLEGYHFIFR
jgi:LPS export ABC transporter protein LptC